MVKRNWKISNMNKWLYYGITRGYFSKVYSWEFIINRLRFFGVILFVLISLRKRFLKQTIFNFKKSLIFKYLSCFNFFRNSADSTINKFSLTLFLTVGKISSRIIFVSIVENRALFSRNSPFQRLNESFFKFQGISQMINRLI